MKICIFDIIETIQGTVKEINYFSSSKCIDKDLEARLDKIYRRSRDLLDFFEREKVPSYKE